MPIRGSWSINTCVHRSLTNQTIATESLFPWNLSSQCPRHSFLLLNFSNLFRPPICLLLFCFLLSRIINYWIFWNLHVAGVETRLYLLRWLPELKPPWGWYGNNSKSIFCFNSQILTLSTVHYLNNPIRNWILHKFFSNFILRKNFHFRQLSHYL